MTGPIVWLASYPKSGNTWVRAVVTALSTHAHFFEVNSLDAGGQPQYVGGSVVAWGLDSRWLTYDENDQVRTALIRWVLPDAEENVDDLPPERTATRLRKTHEVYRHGELGREPFPPDATRAAVLVVRDPRDVACSYAPFFGISIDAAIDAMGTNVQPGPGRPVHCQTAQPWGTWSGHALSWLDEAVPFPVHLLRYEDLKSDAVGVLKPVLDAVGLDVTHERLAAAVEATRFERLRAQEAKAGFRETSPMTGTFFRKGAAGGWRDELTADQVAAIEADHAAVMVRLGYELMTSDSNRRAIAEARAARRSVGPVEGGTPAGAPEL